MSVYCAALECKFQSDTNRCTAKRITLSSHSVMTLWNGRQEFWKCKQYEMSDEYKAVLEQIGQAKDCSLSKEAFDAIIGKPLKIQDADELIFVDPNTHEKTVFKRVKEGE